VGLLRGVRIFTTIKKLKHMKKEKVSIDDLSVMNKASYDSILYRVVTNMTEDFRDKGVSDEMIEKFIINFIKSTIKEV
jgi:hypothetical protein